MLVDSVKKYPSCRWILEPCNHSQRGRLATAGRSEKREELPVAYGQIESTDGGERPEELVDALKTDDCGCLCARRRRNETVDVGGVQRCSFREDRARVDDRSNGTSGS